MQADQQTPDLPWFRDGLAFECTRCGNCCTGAPGYVWLSMNEISAIADHLQITREEFTRTYVRAVDGRLSLIERTNFDCVFWSRDEGCTIYPVRPAQCQTWPFWPEHLATPERWRRLQARCPGAGRGELYELRAIVDAATRAAEALG